MQQRVCLCHPSLCFQTATNIRVVTSVKMERKSTGPFFLRSQCAAVHLSLYQPSGAVGGGAGRAAVAGRGCCLWRRNMCSPPGVLPYLVLLHNYYKQQKVKNNRATTPEARLVNHAAYNTWKGTSLNAIKNNHMLRGSVYLLVIRISFQKRVLKNKQKKNIYFFSF